MGKILKCMQRALELELAGSPPAGCDAAGACQREQESQESQRGEPEERAGGARVVALLS
jgi:hypothetical protein